MGKNTEISLDIATNVAVAKNIHSKGKIATHNAIAKRAPSLIIQKILYSEIVLRSAAHLYLTPCATFS